MNTHFIVVYLLLNIIHVLHGHGDGQKRDSSTASNIQQLNTKVQELIATTTSLDAKVAQLGVLQTLSIQNQAEISRLSTQLQSLANVGSVSAGNGAVYTRWGKKTCPTQSTETLYSGYVSGGSYLHGGSITNYLCLPSHPNNVTRDATLAKSIVNFLYGVEFETNFWKDHSQDQDVPCAVCRNTASSTHLMIPGRNICYPGWKFAYTGYLGSEYYAHTGNKEAICVDDDPDFIDGGSANKDGGLLYPVLSKCGSLECPPYEDGKAVMCVVCLV